MRSSRNSSVRSAVVMAVALSTGITVLATADPTSIGTAHADGPVRVTPSATSEVATANKKVHASATVNITGDVADIARRGCVTDWLWG
ncbi:hypothetical protein AB0392_01175 [Nonomuraea angiospora]|uniref:hypothetical protein n=1 Tax=Nonomuraea angiospora TaxID=46172 RepID=UPI00344EFE3A